ncbi:MAG: response regulator [Myxococcota bacterium]|nr:response regulator [Myxococcota bacterium]
MASTDTNSFSDIPRLLVVDDEKVIREILADFLSLEGFYVVTAPDGAAALRMLEQSKFDMVLSDLKMPGMGGLELLERLRTEHENVLTVIMTGFGTVETAIEAMKKGAYDYILKPFKVEEVVHIVHRGLEKQRLISENIRLKEIISLHELSEALQSTLSFDDVIDSTLAAAVYNVRCDLATLHVRDDELGEHVKIGQLVHADAPPEAEDGALNIRTVLAALPTSRTLLCHGAAQATQYFDTLPRNLVSFLCVPLVARQMTIGLLSLYVFVEESKFTTGQRKLANMIGSRAAAAVDNAKLFLNLQQTFRQTIQSLARALEAMDKYTAGHSDRVTTYARLTAEYLQEPPERVELITQSGMLHDIGKLGCHANLNKQEKLTNQEYEIFKAHPAYGKDILDPISFLRPIIPGVHFHHERWDGKGYPLGLSGESIPSIARILAVADSYDAMTSDRAYRRAMRHDVAVAELRRCAGTQFDPAIVEAFLEAIDQYREERRRQASPIPE